MNRYFQKKQNVAKLDSKGNVLGAIDKWQAHRKGILHKGFSITLIYKNKYILQHRKHPAFDGAYDVTSSSHQLFINGELQTTEEATYECLKREWNLEKSDLSELKNLGSIYYKAKDSKSIYTEHEICEILVAKVNIEPKPNLDFAYGYSLVDKQDLQNKKSRTYENLAPWIKTVIGENKL